MPNIVADFGFPPASAAGVLVWANVGGLLGGLVFAAFTQKFAVRPLTIASMLIATAMVSLFGITPHDLTMLSLVCAVAEFFINGAIVGMYALFAQAFPTHVRAFGSGFAIGLGRGGSFLAPIVAGFLFQAGYGPAGRCGHHGPRVHDGRSRPAAAEDALGTLRGRDLDSRAFRSARRMACLCGIPIGGRNHAHLARSLAVEVFRLWVISEAEQDRAEAGEGGLTDVPGSVGTEAEDPEDPTWIVCQ